MAFNERIRPEIPLRVIRAAKKEEGMEELADELTNCYSRQIASILGQFGDEVGEGFYLLRTAELSGMITISRR